ncbi:MAG: hypothetical protein NT139_01835 [Candidatus Woesearchaeota archaeon]|nr:hypothetical protein [Candidatus Woesearchaeota archaeon]
MKDKNTSLKREVNIRELFKRAFFKKETSERKAFLERKFLQNIVLSKILFILFIIIGSIGIFSSDVLAADPGHDASRIAPGTFESGNYTFPDTAIMTNLLVSPRICLNGDCQTAWPSGSGGSLTNVAFVNESNTFSLINPLITPAESWIGPSSTTGIYFKAGNVGIGTTNPQAKLDLWSNIDAINGPLLSIRGDAATIGHWFSIRFGDQSQTTAYQKGAIIYESVSSSARGKFHIALENTDGSGSVALSDAKLTVQSNGNVGIGTTSPDSKLTVAGTLNVTSSSTFLQVDSNGNVKIGI